MYYWALFDDTKKWPKNSITKLGRASIEVHSSGKYWSTVVMCCAKVELTLDRIEKNILKTLVARLMESFQIAGILPNCRTLARLLESCQIAWILPDCLTYVLIPTCNFARLAQSCQVAVILPDCQNLARLPWSCLITWFASKKFIPSPIAWNLTIIDQSRQKMRSVWFRQGVKWGEKAFSFDSQMNLKHTTNLEMVIFGNVYWNE